MFTSNAHVILIPKHVSSLRNYADERECAWQLHSEAPGLDLQIIQHDRNFLHLTHAATIFLHVKPPFKYLHTTAQYFFSPLRHPFLATLLFTRQSVIAAPSYDAGHEFQQKETAFHPTHTRP